jgi:hypothetical protein
MKRTVSVAAFSPSITLAPLAKTSLETDPFALDCNPGRQFNG